MPVDAPVMRTTLPFRSDAMSCSRLERRRGWRNGAAPNCHALYLCYCRVSSPPGGGADHGGVPNRRCGTGLPTTLSIDCCESTPRQGASIAQERGEILRHFRMLESVIDR